MLGGRERRKRKRLRGKGYEGREEREEGGAFIFTSAGERGNPQATPR